MLDFIRTYKRHFLAIIGVFLMIAFIIPYSGRIKDEFAGATFGKIGDTPIQKLDIDAARRDMDVMSTRLSNPMGLNPMSLTLANYFYGQYQDQQTALLMGISLARSLNDKPIEYFILLNEAQKMNVVVNPEDVKALVKMFMQPEDSVENTDYYSMVVTNWMMIMGAFDRYAAVDQSSMISSMYEYVGPMQSAKFQVLEFNAMSHSTETTPTADELKAFYEKYKNKDPLASDDGLGYKFPNRVRFHYIKVPYELALKSVTADEAAEYYYFNQLRAPTTQAATQPSTLASSQPASQPAEITLPWKLNNETDKWARQQIAHERVASIAKEVLQGLNAEWSAYKEAIQKEDEANHPKSNGQKAPASRKKELSDVIIPKNPPMTELGVPYLTSDKERELEFMLKLAKKVEESKESHGVKLVVDGTLNLVSMTEILNTKPDIAKSLPTGFNSYFMNYITQFVDRLADEKTKRIVEKNQQIQMMEIGRASRQPFVDEEGNLYVFRVVEAEKSREPKDLDEVKARVENDWKVNQAFLNAKNAAGNFCKDAQASGFAKAAESRGLKDKVINTDWINRTLGPSKIADVPSVPQGLSADFITNSFKAYSDKILGKGENPIVNFDMPKMNSAFVVGLVDAKPAETSSFILKLLLPGQTESTHRKIVANMLMEWFDTDVIHSRNNYDPNAQ